MQRTTILGNVGKDAEVKSINGKSVINFSVGVSEKYKGADGVQKEYTTWFNAQWWVESYQVAKYITKGSKIYVEGTVQAKAYKDFKGEAKASLNLTVQSLEFCSKLGADRNSVSDIPDDVRKYPLTEDEMTKEPTDDLPF